VKLNDKIYMKTLRKILLFLVPAGILFASCEGPMGPGGEDGMDGADLNANCTECHNSSVVDAKAREYEHSLHFTGEAYARGTSTACAPCHSHQGFLYVVENNTPATFVTDPSNPARFINNYSVNSATTAFPGKISCFTCHSSVHTNYTADEFSPLTTDAPVALNMWGGTKSINFAKKEGNLCAKCHQPRPVTASTGNVIDYTSLVSAGTTNYNMTSIGYRTGVHYGTQGSMAAGVGGIEFGTGYTNSEHVTKTSCSSCHMATPSGMTGGHSFDANFNGCNVSGCHSNMSATSPMYTAAIEDIETKLSELAAKINAIGEGHDILALDPEDNHYHGYFNVYEGSNPTGYWRNPSQGNVPFPTLTNAQFGAILNYQLVYRDGSHGIHNYPYTIKLLENSLAAW
jgi:hypothetical protein